VATSEIRQQISAAVKHDAERKAARNNVRLSVIVEKLLRLWLRGRVKVKL